MKRILLLIVALGALLILGPSDLFGQRTVSGVVTDGSNGEPLIGATVLEKGTQNGTITGIDGEYSIDVSSETSVLVYSYVGYQTAELPVSGLTIMNVTMEAETESLDEVVVIAYGTQKKSHLTGSVSSLKNDGLDEIPVSRADQALLRCCRCRTVAAALQPPACLPAGIAARSPRAPSGGRSGDG